MRTTLGLVCLFLAASACAGSGDAGSEGGTETDGFRSYVVDVLATEGEPGEIDIGPVAAGCIADETFDEIGADRFRDVGFDPSVRPAPSMSSFDEAWTDAEWTALTDAVFTCLDVEALFTDVLVSDGIDRSVAECLSERYSRSGYLRIGLASRGELTTEEVEAIAALSELFEQCAAAD